MITIIIILFYNVKASTSLESILSPANEFRRVVDKETSAKLKLKHFYLLG